MAQGNIPSNGVVTLLAKPVSAVSAEVLAENLTRTLLMVQNPSKVGGVANLESVWLNFVGGTAVANSPSFEVVPGATHWWLNEATPTGRINGRTDAALFNLTVWER
jgi:hypothetical protein